MKDNLNKPSANLCIFIIKVDTFYISSFVPGWICLLKVILKEDVLDLGKQGQLLDVKAGFFRNFLLPTGKAQLMTPLLLK